MRQAQQHNPVVDMVQYQLDASIQLADVVFSGTEKIDRAVLDVTHQAVDSHFKLVRAMTNMRDPSKMADLQSALAHRPEKAMHCQQQIMSALVEMQTEQAMVISRLLLVRFVEKQTILPSHNALVIIEEEAPEEDISINKLS